MSARNAHVAVLAGAVPEAVTTAPGAGRASETRPEVPAAPRAPRTPLAQAAPTVAGLVPMSSVDWPGRLAATLFLQGCPWRCVYCHNTDLLDPRAAGQVSWEEVLALLKRRRGLLDGVVFSGGEATRQEALVGAIEQVRELGFGVALHTAGAYPARLERVLPLVDWVGLDIKALPENYATVVQVGGRPAARGQRPGAGAVCKAGESAWRSLDLVLAEQRRRPEFSAEVRMTVCPSVEAAAAVPSPQERTVRDAVEVARRCRAAGVESFALQEARPQGIEPAAADGIAAALGDDRGRTWRSRWDGLVRDIEALEFAQFEVRAA